MSSQHRLRVPEIPPPDAVYVSVILWLCSHLTWQDYWWGQCFLFPVSEHECTQGSRLLLSRREQTAKAHMTEGRVCVKNGGERLGTEDALPDLCPFAQDQPWDLQAQAITWQWKGWWRQPVQSFLSDFPTSSSPCPIPAVFFFLFPVILCKQTYFYFQLKTQNKTTPNLSGLHSCKHSSATSQKIQVLLSSKGRCGLKERCLRGIYSLWPINQMG